MEDRLDELKRASLHDLPPIGRSSALDTYFDDHIKGPAPAAQPQQEQQVQQSRGDSGGSTTNHHDHDRSNKHADASGNNTSSPTSLLGGEDSEKPGAKKEVFINITNLNENYKPVISVAAQPASGLKPCIRQNKSENVFALANGAK